MKRYDLDESKGYPIAQIVEDDIGDYVLFSEADARIGELESENKRLNGMLDTVAKRINDLTHDLEGRLKMRDECQHGSLSRSCEICERDTRIGELRAEVAKLTRDGNVCMAMLDGARKDKKELTAERDAALESLKSRCQCKFEITRVDDKDAYCCSPCKYHGKITAERDHLREAMKPITAVWQRMITELTTTALRDSWSWKAIQESQKVLKGGDEKCKE